MATPEEDARELLQTLSLLNHGSGALIDALVRDAREVTLQKKEMVAAIGEPASRFFIVRSGWLKLYRESFDGAEAIIDILTVGHTFGETSLFQDQTYPYNAEATESCKVLSLPLKPIREEIESNGKFALAMMGAMSNYRRHLDMELEHRTLQSAPQRLGCFLLRLADQSQTGAVEIKLPYDKSLVASRLGMKPETFSRALAKLKADSKINVQGAVIHIADINQLSDYSCSACSAEYPCRDKIHAASI